LLQKWEKSKGKVASGGGDKGTNRKYKKIDKNHEKERIKIVKPKTITMRDAEKIREHLNHQDRVIFDMSIETGCRISDILSLRKSEIDKTMHIKEAKTGKHKTVTLSDALLARIPRGSTLGVYKPSYAFPSTYKHGKHIHRSSYHRRLKKVCKALKIDFSAHSTRKLYALNIFERTNDIFKVQEAMNHKYVTTTAAYLDIDLMALISSALQSKSTEPSS